MPAGADPPITIVFLHHFGGSTQTWAGVIGHLMAEYDCVAPDLRGFGSSKTIAGPYTLRRYADDMADLVERLGLDRYILVGHSMGGKIALAFAARRPPGLASLVLLAPSPPTPEPMTEKDRAATLAGYGDREAALATIAKITARPLPKALADRTADDMLRSSQAAWAAWLENGSRQDIVIEVDGLAISTLVVSGTKDRVIPLDMQIAETLPRLGNGRLVTMNGMGHLLPLEVPEAVADTIRGACRRA